MGENVKHIPYVHPKSKCSIDGVIHMQGVTKEFLDDIKDLPVKDKDLFVATYPKSGTTWVSEIIHQICCDGNVDGRVMRERVVFLEMMKILNNIKTNEELNDLYLNYPSPRIFKTHLRYHEVPMGDGKTNKPKYIYVVRNPKDTSVSFYHHYRRLNYYKFCDRTWDEFFEMFIDGRVEYGSWFDHVLGWWAHRDEDNILFLKYEDMKKDLPCAVQQIAKFLGKDLCAEMIQRIADQTTFTAMSDGKGRFYDGDPNGLKMRNPGTTKFLRKGEVGDWKNYFTDEQNRQFDEMYEQRMAGSGLDLEF